MARVTCHYGDCPATYHNDVRNCKSNMRRGGKLRTSALDKQLPLPKPSPVGYQETIPFANTDNQQPDASSEPDSKPKQEWADHNKSTASADKKTIMREKRNSYLNYENGVQGEVFEGDERSISVQLNMAGSPDGSRAASPEEIHCITDIIKSPRADLEALVNKYKQTPRADFYSHKMTHRDRLRFAAGAYLDNSDREPWEAQVDGSDMAKRARVTTRRLKLPPKQWIRSVGDTSRFDEAYVDYRISLNVGKDLLESMDDESVSFSDRPKVNFKTAKGTEVRGVHLVDNLCMVKNPDGKAVDIYHADSGYRVGQVESPREAKMFETTVTASGGSVNYDDDGRRFFRGVRAVFSAMKIVDQNPDGIDW